ncbi:hypothetical protein KM043_006811 [Ampulex compressa]|nr:hypothetical protein KM043_006811 [Ampulex compressa]
MSNPDTRWMISLGNRDNLLNVDIPHVPIMLEDIPKYIALKNFEKDCIKTVQTIGEIVPKNGRNVILTALTPGIKIEFPMSLKNLRIEHIYVKNAQNAYTAIWEENNVFKVYGVLQKKEGGMVLEATCLSKVKDVMGSLETLHMLSKLARREYRQYNRTPKLDRLVESYWDKMKRKGMRLTEVYTEDYQQEM